MAKKFLNYFIRAKIIGKGRTTELSLSLTLDFNMEKEEIL